MNGYEATIGLEVHLQLRTRSKLFCGCPTEFGAPPNTHVCPVCLGYPGTLPVLNRQAVRLTVRAGLLLGSRISPLSKFDRKSYFYPDMPKNYQISQYDRPLCEGGAVPIDTGGSPRPVAVRRIHLEEDVGKNVHLASSSGVDFNRAGIPLMEVVSEPDLASPDEAMDFLLALKQIMQYGGISDCNLEQGNLRCDVNCSVRPRGCAGLGTKTEIKNLNSFKGVHAALTYEIGRQVDRLAAGGAVAQETRRWDPDSGATFSMRSKEEAHDYRYFAEPDLMPVVLSPAEVAAWRAELPELPRDRRARLAREYGIPEYDAAVLAADRDVADYYEACARLSANPKGVSNLIMTEMLRLLGERNLSIRDARVTPRALAELVALVDRNAISATAAKDVFAELFERGGRPAGVVQRKGLAQVSDAAVLDDLVARVLAENPKSVADYRGGRRAALQHLVGQVMRSSRGTANPRLVAGKLKEKLDAG